MADIQIAKKPNNINSSFTPAQLDLGLLVDNPPDNYFEQEGNMADDEKDDKKNDKKSNMFNVSSNQPKSSFNLIDKDELESVHGDDNSVIMSDHEFPKVSSDDGSNFGDKNRHDDRHDRMSHDSRDSEESLNKRRKIYMQMKQYCKKKNIEFPSHLRSDSSYNELKSHMSLLRSEYQMEKSVEMCKKMLVSFASVFEYLNNRFDPIGLNMDGWSENINDNKDEYDEVFEELYEKYQEKISCPPEIRLIMMIGGSAASYHVMSTMAKKMGMSGGFGNSKSQKNSESEPINSRSEYHSEPRRESISDPQKDENEDIQDILKQIKQETTNDDVESLSSTATSVRRKRAKKTVGLDDI